MAVAAADSSSHRVPVIGLAGGVGSGKSAAARALATLGCAVIDSDALARAALDRSEIAATLREWWGPAVIGEDSRVNRAAVGRVVFNDAAQRARLEGLIHPLVHEARARLRAGYLADPGVRAIVEDAPLLFEAGIDRECDAVVFVDAPRTMRLGRVADRGWDESELDRREKNQWALDIKRDRADYVVVNDATEAELLSQIRGVLSKILHHWSPASCMDKPQG